MSILEGIIEILSGANKAKDGIKVFVDSKSDDEGKNKDKK